MSYYHRTSQLLLISLAFLLTGCGTYFNQPFGPVEARTSELTARTPDLKEFPSPAAPVVVGVYNFRDQTGQYKSVQNGSTFSTAVPQGGTTMLMKALEDSKWFDVIERENFQSLLNERNIIRDTRKQYRQTSNPNAPNLPPLLYAGLLLEGGIVSYDSNIVTGGIGARYFGVGGSSQYRQDRVTIYLRAVSTSNGRVLKTVNVSKTILSQAVDASLFRYVNFQRLLEAETGYTKNEPVQLAIQEAIEKAVISLIIEGIEDRIWSTGKGAELNQKLVDDYKAEKAAEENVKLYDRLVVESDRKTTLTVYGGTSLFDGDYGDRDYGALFGISASKKVLPKFNVALAAGYQKLKGGTDFDLGILNTDLNIEFDPLPNDNFAPIAYVGVGSLFSSEVSSAKFQYGLSLEYRFSPKLGIRGFAEHNLTFSDELDGIVNGKRDDHYFNFGIGLSYYIFGKPKPKKDQPIEQITQEEIQN